MLKKNNRRLIVKCVVLAAAFVFAAGLALQAKGPPEGKGPGGGETAGVNNLSFPVLFSDGFGLTGQSLATTTGLPGAPGYEKFEGVYACLEDPCITYWYLQQDPDNVWQASYIDGTGAPVNVNSVDWGDNLESTTWSTTSKVRVEVVLFQNLVPNEAVFGYTMGFIGGLGKDEMWGTSTVKYTAAEATVYSNLARLTIQKIASQAAPNLAWEAASGQWVGTDAICDPVFNGAVWEAYGGVDGPTGGYSAEINVKGKVIYGYNLDMRNVLLSDPTEPRDGWYRLTFSFDNNPAVTGYTLNTFFTEATEIYVTPGEEITTLAEPTGYQAVIVPALNLSYIDIYIQARSGGGGGGGKGGGGGGGGGHK